MVFCDIVLPHFPAGGACRDAFCPSRPTKRPQPCFTNQLPRKASKGPSPDKLLQLRLEMPINMSDVSLPFGLKGIFFC